MNDLLQKLSVAVESGKINKVSPFPPAMKGMDGADELCLQALEAGIKPESILNDALITGMARIGQKFSEGKAYVPEMLIAAKAMTAAMKHIKPFFTSGEIKRKGVFVAGTVMGDLHDIGKNIVAMTIEGAGWEVIDLGVDVKAEQFMEVIEQHPDCVIGMSALLTTTMANMENTVRVLKSKYPDNKIIVGGAPLSTDFCNKIGADFYSASPQGAVEYLKHLPC
jgi:5-methyltetrahydrofolate--homocysteine methyltransferase